MKDENYEDVGIARSEQHEKWDKKLLINDIAILYLQRDVTFNGNITLIYNFLLINFVDIHWFINIDDKIHIDHINPTCLPISEKSQKHRLAGTNPFIIRWSKSEHDVINKLQVVQLPIVSNKDCKNRYKRVGYFTDNVQFSDLVICAGFTTGTKDLFQGFSGGPLMLPIHENGKFPFYQIGINSYGYYNWRQNIPNVYTNLLRFVDWIQEKIAQ